MNVEPHIRPANWWFGPAELQKCYQLGRVAFLGRGRVASGVSCLRLSGGGGPVPLHLHRVCRFFAMPFWQGGHPAVLLWRSIAGCRFIAAFTCLSPGNSKHRFCSSLISAGGFLMRHCISFIAAPEKPSWAMFTTFKARRMSDSSNCTRPPCLATVADMLKTY